MTILAHPPPEECHAFEKHSLLQEQCCVKQDREGEERKLARPRIHCNFVLLKAINKRMLGSGGEGHSSSRNWLQCGSCFLYFPFQKGQGSRMMCWGWLDGKGVTLVQLFYTCSPWALVLPSLVPELRRPATTKVLSEGMKADTFETKLLLNSLNSSMAISASL